MTRLPLDPELPGWLSEREAELLQRSAAGRVAIEIGSWKGRSAVHLAAVAKRLFCVDHFRGDGYTGHGWFLPEFLANIKRFGVDGRIVTVVGQFADALPLLSLDHFTFAFYDADHDYEPTFSALSALAERLPPDALLAVHDYSSRYPKVKAATAAALGGWKLSDQAESLAIFRR
jgi:predicted O-methyltransferase YrrM